MDNIDITRMQVKQTGRIVSIDGGHGLVRRLEAMGIRPGVTIIKLSGQLMQGPVIVQVGSTQLALGFGMARKIKVTTS